jgi:hypothetical protein
MRKPFCCESSRHMFDQYYARQQMGEGDFPVYVGRLSQQGHGLGDILRGLVRRILPIMKTMAPYVLRAGANIIQDHSGGTKWKTAAIRRVPESLNDYIISKRKQSGSGLRKSRIVKRKKRDIFS